MKHQACSFCTGLRCIEPAKQLLNTNHIGGRHMKCRHMEYKLFKVMFIDGEWRTSTPQFYYIAKNKDEVIRNSKEYESFMRMREVRGGDIHITEDSDVFDQCIENLKEFNVSITIEKKI